jgi:hypothetical protein
MEVNKEELLDVFLDMFSEIVELKSSKKNKNIAGKDVELLIYAATYAAIIDELLTGQSELNKRIDKYINIYCGVKKDNEIL